MTLKKKPIAILSLTVIIISYLLIIYNLNKCSCIGLNVLLDTNGGCSPTNTRCFTQTPGCPQLLCWGAGQYKACGGICPGYFCSQQEEIMTVCTCLSGITLEVGKPLKFKCSLSFCQILGPYCD